MGQEHGVKPQLAKAEGSARLAPGEDGEHITFCRICEPVCGLTVTVKDGRMTKVRPDRDNPHSQGHVCIKGTSALDLVYDPDRVVRPLRRIGGAGEFEEVSWPEAMEDIAQRLATIMRESGPDGVSNYIGNPTAFSTSAQVSLRPFMEHFGIRKLFCAATQDTSSRMMASYLLYGSSSRYAIPDLPRCNLLLMFGANPLVSHGSVLSAPLIRQDLDAIARRGRVIVFDPRRTETAAQYEHVPVRPDTDVWVLAGLIHVLFSEGLVDTAALEKTTVDWRRLRGVAGEVTPEVASLHSGVPADQIVGIARAFAKSNSAAAYGRVGICRGSFSTLTNFLLDCLNIVGGKFGVEGGWVFGEPPLDRAALRPSGFEIRETRFGAVSCVGGNLPFHLLIDDILVPGPGRVRALLMESGNIVLSAPGGERLEKALQALELHVSVDLYVNETNRYAHFILPGTTFFEREDVPVVALSFMVRPFIQYTDAVVPPVGDTRDDHDIFNQLAQRLHDLLSEAPGCSGYARPAAPAFHPMRAVDTLLRQAKTTVSVGGSEVELSLDVLKDTPHGISLADGLTCSNSYVKVLTEDGKIRLWHDYLDAEVDRLRRVQTSFGSQLKLFSRRDLRSINSWMHNVERLVRSQEPLLLMHPLDALARGIQNRDRVSVTSEAGAITTAVELSSDVVEGSVCYPHGWGHRGGWRRANAGGGANVNVLADVRGGEALSASSWLDGILVSVAKVGKDESGASFSD